MGTKWGEKYDDPDFCWVLRSNEKDDCIFYPRCLKKTAKQKYGRFVPCDTCDKYQRVKESRNRV